jgi:FkbM family methyltransferase
MNYQEISELLDTLREAFAYIRCQSPDADVSSYSYLFRDILDAQAQINKTLFLSPRLKDYPTEAKLNALSSYADALDLVALLEQWSELITQTLRKRQSFPTNIDAEFDWLMDFVLYVDKETIIQTAKSNLLNNDKEIIKALNFYYQTYHYFWGSLDTEKGIYDVIENRVRTLIEHREDFIWLYHRLGDYRSKIVLLYTLCNWITFNLQYINNMRENNFRDYYDLDLLHCDANEVMVDLGAYTGDSTKDFIDTYHNYRKIYCYEITPKTVDVMKQNLSIYPNIEIRNKGVGSKAGYMYIDSSNINSTNMLNSSSGKKIEVVTLDDDIPEKITLLKMDIEGSEQDALKGSRRHIMEDRPKLLVCVYHGNRDIFEIPRMILDMREDYKLYLRSNGNQWGPSEIVLFAL